MDHPVTLQQERKVWTIHQSVSGTTYYYNRATKKSQYEMPECFKTTEEVLQHPDWKEYRTAEGKKFYYNASTRRSCWQLPNEVKEFRMRLEEKRKKDKQEGKVEESEEISETEKLKRKFMGLLKNKLIGVTTKWDACIKLCEDDERWGSLRMGEKKKYFNEYIADLKKISEQEKRAKIQVNKTQFLKMLKENKNLTSDCKMHKVAYDFMTDPRWRLLEEHERQNAFQAYMEQLWQQEKQTAIQQKRQHIDAFRAQLEKDCLKHNTKWDDARITYKPNEHWKELHPYDRLSAFIDYILEAEKQHEEFMAKERRLRDRTNRCAFREMLREKLTSGELAYKTKWREFITDNRSDKRLLNMMDQAGTSAHQIFEFFMEDVRQKHKAVKGEIKSHFKKTGFRMNEETSNAEFKERLEELPIFNTLLPHHQDYFHRYFHNKIRSKKEAKSSLSGKKAVKKERKTIFKIFRQLQEKDLLRSKYGIESQMDHVQRSMKAQGYVVTHEAIFKYYLAFLERCQEENKGRADSKSSRSSSEPRKQGKGRHKVEEVAEESQFASMRKFKIPEQVKPMVEGEEEGEIKSEEEEPAKKRKKSKKKKKSSSSDSI